MTSLSFADRVRTGWVPLRASFSHKPQTSGIGLDRRLANSVGMGFDRFEQTLGLHRFIQHDEQLCEVEKGAKCRGQELLRKAHPPYLGQIILRGSEITAKH